MDGSGLFSDFSNTALLKDGTSCSSGGYAVPLLPGMILGLEDLLSGVYNAVASAYRKYAQSIKSSIANMQPGNYPVIHHIVPYGAYSTRNSIVREQLRKAQQIMRNAGIEPQSSLYNQVAISASYHASLHSNDYILMVTNPIIALGEDATEDQIIAVLWDLRIVIAANDPDALGY